MWKCVEVEGKLVYASSWKVYFGMMLCKVGLHNKRRRKNGKHYEYVCKRPNCNYCEKV